MTSFVKKADSRKEQFDPEKIKKVIAWATDGIDVNPLVLESKFDEFIRDGISTDDLQSNLIYHSRILCTPTDPDWSLVAGRLETMRRWKATQIFEKSFHYYVKEQLDAGHYTHPAIKKWTKREIMELGEAIVQERDLEHSYGSVLTAKEKYLVPNECIQQMHMVNAMIVASVSGKSNRVELAEDIYEALSLRKISLATPWLSNLRCNKNISSCFIIQVDDDMESIFDNVKNAALISKFGGGLGIDMSRIRAKNASVGSVPNASKGMTSWTKIFNDVAVAVDQGGKRAGAFTVHLPIWHRDIEDFIEIQSENGDFRKKAFDIFPQVGIYDIFMKEKEKEDGGTWHTFCPHTVRETLGLELVGVFGKEFATVYRKCVNAYNAGKLDNVAVYNAK
ncbi:MAG: ribonucleoside-diphosphate reductase subunit alpha, partial [Gammaproteobacteria bacterium]|nr:ribonucleoside-diphosphate reductase subunit alpha [Gammaproteobacteria bacterium]